MTDTSDNLSVYTKGITSGLDNQPAYFAGGGYPTDNQACYLNGGGASTSSLSAYIPSSGTTLSSRFAYVAGGTNESIHAYAEGGTVAVEYITLRTSDSSVEKKFKVIAEGYDDGTLEKAESRKRTLGGGTDVSVGSVYKTWAPTIKVRHTEPETGYGTLADLEYFYELNDPNGTPSNVITFIDHHSVTYSVRTLGTLSKAVLGASIEGSEAWYLVRIRLERV